MRIPGEIEGLPVKKIGSWTFNECNFLEEVELPDGVEEIGQCVFWYCSSLEKISLSDRLV